MPATRSILAALGAVFLLGCGRSNAPILVGLTGPFSEPVGQSMRLGAELAVSGINERGGVRGRRLELLPADDRGQAETAVDVARRYRDNRAVIAVIGHAGNATTASAAAVYGAGANPVVLITPSATGPEVGRNEESVFRICPDDIAHAVSLAEWAHGELAINTAAILYRNDSDSRAMSAAFRREFVARGGQILAADPFSEALPSFEPYLARAARRGDIESLLIVGGGPSIKSVLATLDSVGLRPVILSSGDHVPFLSVDGAGLDNVFVSTAYLPERGGAGNESFVTAFRQAHGGRLPDPAAAFSYDIVHLIARAAAVAGPDRAGIRDYLAGVGTATGAIEGATGTIAFDVDGNVTRKIVEIGVVRAGTLAPASER